ncbi:Flp family type IVb pilin [uncultured Sphingomonas sp.]|uniref:Flp family type IVb pilin n=1 Tax=uncultured Sphingomonas sp. TaxID=158754 RepID=UPI0035CB3854
MRHARRFGRDSKGATAVEYGLIITLVVLAMIVGLRETAKVTIDMWNDISTKVQAAR